MIARPDPLMMAARNGNTTIARKPPRLVEARLDLARLRLLK